MRPSTFLASTIVVAFACGKDPPASQPPTDPTPVADASPADDPPPSDDEDLDEADLDDDGDDEADATDEADDDGRLTREQAETIAREALEVMLGTEEDRLLSPPLPTSWPLDGKVAYFVYPLAPDEGGAVDSYRVSSPTHRAVLDVVAGEVTVEPVTKSKKLGRYTHARVRQDPEIAKAEQALLDVAAGRSTPDQMHHRLAAYGRWFDGHGAVGKDARRRTLAFAEWADSWGK